MDNDTPSGAAGPEPRPAPQINLGHSARPSWEESRWVKWAATAVLILILTGAAYWMLRSPKSTSSSAQSASSSTNISQPPESPGTQSAQGLQLDSKKNYGNKYADSILPVGDNKYVTGGPKEGYVYVCSNYARNLQTDAGGAGRRGPWFVGTTKYDLNKKITVSGSVKWQPHFSDEVSGAGRTIDSNDLPSQPTGIFPITPNDPAYAYDKNPNSIQAQDFTYALDSSPSYGSPSCVGGQVGVMLTGVALFSGFDAGGRDAGAWEVQDSCQGHPQSGGIYHYHTLSSCIKDTSVSTVIGFALDGFPITGPKVGADNILTSADLDECHGLTSQVVLDGKKVAMYHYVMTQDFPYSVSCYRGHAIQPPGIKAPPH